MTDDEVWRELGHRPLPRMTAPRSNTPAFHAGLVRLAASANDIRLGGAPGEVSRRLVDAVRVEIAAARWCSITGPAAGRVVTIAATDETARLLDVAQDAAGEGPALTLWQGWTGALHSPDLDRERRWPRFAALATALGARSLLSYHLHSESGTWGALHIYAEEADAFSVDSDDLGRLMALFASLALDAAHVNEQLRVVSESRETIGRATGILMERQQLSAEAASGRLLDAARRNQLPVWDVAVHFLATGSLPEPHGAR